jgi:hypothetical protein
MIIVIIIVIAVVFIGRVLLGLPLTPHLGSMLLE